MNGAGWIRTPGSVAVKVQAGRLIAVQSIVGSGSRETSVGTIDGAREGVAVVVGVMVGMVVGVGVRLAVEVAVGGGLVQVAGRATCVLAGTGGLVGVRAAKSRGRQPVMLISIREIKNQHGNRWRLKNRSCLPIQIEIRSLIIHPTSADSDAIQY
jgi:hypothetical protein